MAWVPPIESIRFLYASGTGNMGDVTTDSNHSARFRFMEASRFVPVSLQIHFFGGTGTADCKMKVRSSKSGPYGTDGDESTGGEFDAHLLTFEDAGQGADVNLRLEEGDYEGFVFDKGDQIVFEWTDPGTTYWGIRLALAAAPGGDE